MADSEFDFTGGVTLSIGGRGGKIFESIVCGSIRYVFLVIFLDFGFSDIPINIWLCIKSQARRAQKIETFETKKKKSLQL